MFVSRCQDKINVLLVSIAAFYCYSSTFQRLCRYIARRKDHISLMAITHERAVSLIITGGRNFHPGRNRTVSSS